MPESNIYELDRSNLQALVNAWGEPAYRADQLWEGLYRHYWNRTEQFSTLPRSLQNKLASNFSQTNALGNLSTLQPIRVVKSTSGETTKTLFHLHDEQSIEVVLMNYSKRNTLCISTQVGCSMGCVFCATGQMGFRRNLSSGEIVEQVLYYARHLASQNEQVTNIVVMGMGEPFHNYDPTMQAIDRLNNSQGFNFSARRFTVSTVGLVPAIRRFTLENRQVNLAVSLHAADDILRNSLLPINNKYSLDDLFSACLEYVRTTHRRISFEWALIDGVNDTITHARELAIRLQPFRQKKGMLCHVNIIQLNPTQKYSGQSTPRQRALDFATELEKQGIPCTIRLRRGIDIQAGCGQLATHNLINSKPQ